MDCRKSASHDDRKDNICFGYDSLKERIVLDEKRSAFLPGQQFIYNMDIGYSMQKIILNLSKKSLILESKIDL